MARLPGLARIGLILLAVATVASLFAGPVPAAHQHGGHALQAHAAHLAVLAGMALMLAGVVVDGARRHRSQRRNLDAHR